MRYQHHAGFGWHRPDPFRPIIASSVNITPTAPARQTLADEAYRLHRTLMHIAVSGLEQSDKARRLTRRARERYERRAAKQK